MRDTERLLSVPFDTAGGDPADDDGPSTAGL
jgi:hypothetical protein